MIATRSSIVAVGVRVVSPLAIVLAVFLFFAGHNQPGGGFAAGLVLGSVVALRKLAGLGSPFDAITLLSVGGVICGLVAVAPLVVGDTLLDQVVVERTVPVLGKVKSGSAAIFDLGVTAIVVGLVAAVLDGLGPSDDRSAHDGSAHDRSADSRESASEGVAS